MTVVEGPPIRPTHRWGNTALAVVGVLLLVLGAPSMLFHSLAAIVSITIVIGLVSRAWGAYRKDLELGLLREPRASRLRWYRIQLLLRTLFFVAFLSTGAPLLSLLPFLGESSSTGALVVVAIVGVVWLLLSLVPRKRIAIATNVAFAIGTLVVAGLWLMTLRSPAGDRVELAPPFEGDFMVFQGGQSVLYNHHYIYQQQRHALDIMLLKDGTALVNDGDELTDFVGFGATLHAPAAGKIVKVVGDQPDADGPAMNFDNPVGNHVVIDMGNDRYVLLAHIKKDSITVKEGDEVEARDPIAQCGNSGNTSAPHLHLQVQSSADFKADGLFTYPIAFREARRTRDGEPVEDDVPLRRSDRLVSVPRLGKP